MVFDIELNQTNAFSGCFFQRLIFVSLLERESGLNNVTQFGDAGK